MSGHVIRVVLTNEDEGHRFSDFTEDVEWPWQLNDDGAPNIGGIYRDAVREYGRCVSKVYIERDDGDSIPIGWYFVKRARYDRPVRTCQDRWCDKHYTNTYLQGAWVTVHEITAEATPRILAPMAVGR